MAYCLLEQDIYADFIKEGCVRYSTVDSSPQGPFDFVMHGSRTIAIKDMVGAFRDAHRLFHRGDLGLDGHDLQTIAARLETLLHLSQGVPTAVGSGHQSLRRKVHAVAHSTRLSAPFVEGDIETTIEHLHLDGGYG